MSKDIVVDYDFMRDVPYMDVPERAGRLHKTSRMLGCEFHIQLPDGYGIHNFPFSNVWLQLADKVTSGDKVIKSRDGNITNLFC